jgi:hypothetical protein
VEHDYLPWAKRCHELANVLDIHKIIGAEGKRWESKVSESKRTASSAITGIDRRVLQYSFSKANPDPGRIGEQNGKVKPARRDNSKKHGQGRGYT